MRQTENHRWLALVLLGVSSPFLAAQAPEPRGYINDFAQVLDPQVREQLESAVAKLRQETETEISVAIIETLAADSAEPYALQLAQQWEVGALLLISVDGPQHAIAVRPGLAAALSAEEARRIAGELTPFLRQADYNTAVEFGVAALSQAISGAAPRETVEQSAWSPALNWLPLAIVAALLLIPRRRRVGGWDGVAVADSWMLGSAGRLDSNRCERDRGAFSGFSGGPFGGGSTSSW